MKSGRIGKGVITRDVIRIAAGLGLRVLLLLAAPAALAELDLGPANGNAVFNETRPGGNVYTIVNGSDDRLNVSFPNWMIGGRHTRIPDPPVGRRPEIFRRLPVPREHNGNSSSGKTIHDPPVVPEPSTAIAASLLLLPLAASALRVVRKRK